MIELPDVSRKFDYENNFYLSCNTQRISKCIAHYELFKKIINVPGEIVECGVFKGASFTRWAHFRNMLLNNSARKIIGFDIFGEFPDTNFEGDKAQLEKFINSAGNQSISVEQLTQVLENNNLNSNVELIKGDILLTVPEYIKAHPELKIALLNLDTDIYEPAVTILENLFPHIATGGVLLIDDYGVFPGETKAVDDYFKDHDFKICRLPYAKTPAYLIKQ